MATTATTVKAASETSVVPEASSVPGFDERIAKIIADGIAAGLAASAPRRKVTFGEYDPKTPWHPNKRNRKHLTRTCSQNGAWIDDDRIDDEAIENLNKITRAGRYIGRRVEVVIRQEGSEDTLDLRYKCKDANDRAENSHHWRSFNELVQLIVAEQEAAKVPDSLR